MSVVASSRRGSRFSGFPPLALPGGAAGSGAALPGKYGILLLNAQRGQLRRYSFLRMLTRVHSAGALRFLRRRPLVASVALPSLSL